MSEKRKERKKAALDKQIDENLKRVYQEDTEKDIPEHFIELLQKLRDQG